MACYYGLKINIFETNNATIIKAIEEEYLNIIDSRKIPGMKISSSYIYFI
jgi:hypothetical protein